MFREVEVHADNALHDHHVIKRLQNIITHKHGSMTFRSPHVIDLSPAGWIGPHVDSIKFSGDIVAGLSLLSCRVMRLTLDETSLTPNNDDDYYQQLRNLPASIDLLLPSKSMYILNGPFRYHYTHEILNQEGTNNSLFCTRDNIRGHNNDSGERLFIEVARRLSIIVRNDSTNKQ